MILAGFDNINVTLQMNPKEVKILYHALDHITTQQNQAIAEQMRAKNFKEYGSKEVFAVLKQFQLAVGAFAHSLERADEAPDTPPDASTGVIQ